MTTDNTPQYDRDMSKTVIAAALAVGAVGLIGYGVLVAWLIDDYIRSYAYIRSKYTAPSHKSSASTTVSR